MENSPKQHCITALRPCCRWEGERDQTGQTFLADNVGLCPRGPSLFGYEHRSELCSLTFFPISVCRLCFLQTSSKSGEREGPPVPEGRTRWLPLQGGKGDAPKESESSSLDSPHPSSSSDPTSAHVGLFMPSLGDIRPGLAVEAGLELLPRGGLTRPPHPHSCLCPLTWPSSSSNEPLPGQQRKGQGGHPKVTWGGHLVSAQP